MTVVFGEGKYSVAVQDEILDSIAEDVVHDVCIKLPSRARTPEIIKHVIKRAKKLTGSMLVTCASQAQEKKRGGAP